VGETKITQIANAPGSRNISADTYNESTTDRRKDLRGAGGVYAETGSSVSVAILNQAKTYYEQGLSAGEFTAAIEALANILSSAERQEVLSETRHATGVRGKLRAALRWLENHHVSADRINSVSDASVTVAKCAAVIVTFAAAGPVPAGVVGAHLFLGTDGK
jgi:hypothetical protein